MDECTESLYLEIDNKRCVAMCESRIYYDIADK